MLEVEVRPAIAADAAALTAIIQGSTTYHGAYRPMVDGLEVTPAYLATHPTAVAEGDGAIAGFYSLILDPPELDLMFVADHAQGLGIGRRLIDHLLAEATRRGLLAIRVVSHPPAEGFYLALGARRIGTVGPKPPAITWSRPDLLLDVGRAPVRAGLKRGVEPGT